MARNLLTFFCSESFCTEKMNDVIFPLIQPDIVPYMQMPLMSRLQGYDF